MDSRSMRWPIDTVFEGFVAEAVEDEVLMSLRDGRGVELVDGEAVGPTRLSAAGLMSGIVANSKRKISEDQKEWKRVRHPDALAQSMLVIVVTAML